MSFERNNTALEFESMLRRHIRRAGAMADPCTELDIDTSSAYLEGGLSNSARLRYEAHLSGCQFCRSHLIELSRLEKATAPQHAGRPYPVDSRHLWENLQNAAAGFLDQVEGAVTGWRWNWTVASGALAACMMLAAFLVVQPWRNSVSPEINGSEIALERNDSAAAADPARESADSVSTTDTDPATPTRQRVPSPRIEVSPILNQSAEIGFPSRNLPSINFATRTLSLDMSSALPPVPNTQSFQPQIVDRPADEFIPNRSSAQRLAASPGSFSDNRIASESAASRNAEPPEIAPRINPLPDYNPMHSVSNSNRRSSTRARSEKTTLQVSRPDWSDRVMGFMPIGRPDSSSRPDDNKVPNEDLLQPLTRKIHGKVFQFKNGFWVDQEFKADLMDWRVTRIQTPGREYDRLLADDPQIKEFFILEQFIIVWRGKIYKIVNR